MARMMAIHALLQAQKYPNCRQIGEELEVSSKTAQRDLDFMRDQLSLPLEYDRVKYGYHYTEAVQQFPTVQVSDGELVALLIAQKAVEQYRGTAFEKPLHTAFTKLAAGLQSDSGIAVHELAEAVSFRPQGLAEAELETFQVLAQATLRQESIVFDYLPLHRETAEERHVDPYHLGCLANQWYLIGHDSSRGAVRTFALTRVQRARKSGAVFQRPSDFSVGEMFAGSFSAFQAGRLERIVLRLDAFGARLAAERRWHPSQQLTMQPEGGAELTLEVSLAPDLENWILGWGQHAEVLAPSVLREKVASTAAAMQAIYRQSNP